MAPSRLLLIIVLALGLLPAGLAAAEPSALRQTGKASWYKAHRGITASGATHGKDALTAAHRRLPFGSKVRVTNMRNGRSVVVAITDRGPFVKGRVIDVSEAAARQLGFRKAGTAKVTVEAVR